LCHLQRGATALGPVKCNDHGGGGDHRYDIFRERRGADPLYHQYQESFGLTPFAIATIFAAYVLSLLAALLTVGSFQTISDGGPPFLRR
jgi:hypothetical protein